jgi:hypothetical protein
MPCTRCSDVMLPTPDNNMIMAYLVPAGSATNVPVGGHQLTALTELLANRSASAETFRVE